MPDRHSEIITGYLAAFRAQLRGMSENEKNDLVLELEDHILTRLAEDGVPTGEVLAASAAAHAATSAARAAQSAAQADAAAKVTDLAAVRAQRAALAAESAVAAPAARTAAAVQAVLAALGTPEELARRYDEAPEESAPPEEEQHWQLPPRMARVLTVLMCAGLLAVALAARSTQEWRALQQGISVTEDAERQKLLDRLAAVCGAYRQRSPYYGILHGQSRIFGRECRQYYRVLHADGITRLVPLLYADAVSVRYTDTQTVVWQPVLREYAVLPPRDIEGSTYGPSLLLGLLTGKISEDQCRVFDRDVRKIVRRHDSVTYTFTGAYFGCGDGEYEVVLDAEQPRLRSFTVRRLDEPGYTRSHLACEHISGERTDLPLTAEALALPLPPDARLHRGQDGYNLHQPSGWKGQALVGRPMVPFSAPEVRTGILHTSADLRGRPALVAVLATWIPWDRLYLAAFAALQERYAATGLRIVVLAPEVERRITDAFLAKHPLPYPLLSDFTGWQAPHFAAGRFYAPCDMDPVFLAVAADGRVAAAGSRYYSPISDSVNDLAALLVPVLGEATVQRIERERAQSLASLPEAELLARAEACFAREDDFTGKEYLQAAIDSHRSLAAKLRLCRLYTEYRNEEGKALAEECLAETTTSPYPHLMLGDFYRTDKRNHGRAMREYARALELDPRCWQAYLKQGQSYAARSRYTEAVEAYRQALQIVPENSFVWQQLSVSLRDLRREAELQEALRQVTLFRGLRGASDALLQVEGYGEEVDRYDRLGDYERALERNRLSLRYDPGNRGKLRGLARTLLYQVRRPAEALPVLEQLLRYDYNDIDLYHYAWALAALGRTDEAMAKFDEVLRLDPGNHTAQVAIGLLHARRGDHVAARNAWQTARARFPEFWGGATDEEIGALSGALTSTSGMQ